MKTRRSTYTELVHALRRVRQGARSDEDTGGRRIRSSCETCPIKVAARVEARRSTQDSFVHIKPSSW